MAGYVANIEVKLPGDAIDGAFELRKVLGEHELETGVSVDDTRGMACIALGLEADDGRDATEQALEALDGIWEDTFEDLSPSPVLIVRAVPERRAEQLNFLMPGEGEEEPEGEPEEEEVEA